MNKVTRRELGKMVAGLTAAQALPLDAQAPASSDYIGPLTGVTTDIADRRFDPVAYARDLYAAAPRKMRFQALSKAQAERWQKTLRAKLAELVGLFPATARRSGRSRSKRGRSPAIGERKSCSTAGPASACSPTCCFPTGRRLLLPR